MFIVVILNIIEYAVIAYNYTPNIIKCIVSSVFNHIFGSSVELLVGCLIAFGTGMGYDAIMHNKIIWLIGSAICKLTLISITYNMYIILKKRELFKSPGYYWVIAVCFPACSIFILYFLDLNALSGNLTNYIQIFCIIICIFAMNIMLLCFMTRYAMDRQLRKKETGFRTMWSFRKVSRTKLMTIIRILQRLVMT